MRVLVVIEEPIDADAIVRRCGTLIAQGHEVAICYVSPAQGTLQSTLALQRRITAALRQALEGSAEEIPVFVVSQSEGDGIDDCARDWGAAEVRV